MHQNEQELQKTKIGKALYVFVIEPKTWCGYSIYGQTLIYMFLKVSF